MSEQTTTGTRPAGTSALIYGVIAVAVAAVVTPVAMATHAVLGVLVAGATGVAGVIALVVGVVQRLAGGTKPRPRVRVIAAMAAGPALLAFAFGIVVNVLR